MSGRAARGVVRRLRTLRSLADPRATARRGASALRNARARGAYRVLSEAEMLATRTSDTVFVFGSGRSLLDISAAEWERISAYNTVSLREFPRQHFVRADYHITGEVDFLDVYAAMLRENPFYRDTVFAVQRGWLAEFGNDLIGRRLLPAGARVFRYRRTSRGRYSPPSRSFRDGLVHGFNSIVSSTNFAIAMGWRRIVLTGVDLDNKGYFWLPEGETRTYEQPGITATSMFTGAGAVVELLGRWQALLEPEGIELFVYNPRSLLTQELDVFSWPAQ